MIKTGSPLFNAVTQRLSPEVWARKVAWLTQEEITERGRLEGESLLAAGRLLQREERPLGESSWHLSGTPTNVTDLCERLVQWTCQPLPSLRTEYAVKSASAEDLTLARAEKLVPSPLSGGNQLARALT